MSKWDEYQLEQRIGTVLREVPSHGPPRPMGRPYLTGYQIAIDLDRRWPEVRQGFGSQLGGRGIGQHHSFSQYVARELAQRFERNEFANIEAAFLSSVDVVSYAFRSPTNDVITSSSTESGFDLALFRWIGA